MNVQPLWFCRCAVPHKNHRHCRKTLQSLRIERAVTISNRHINRMGLWFVGLMMAHEIVLYYTRGSEDFSDYYLTSAAIKVYHIHWALVTIDWLRWHKLFSLHRSLSVNTTICWRWIDTFFATHKAEQSKSVSGRYVLNACLVFDSKCICSTENHLICCYEQKPYEKFKVNSLMCLSTQPSCIDHVSFHS